MKLYADYRREISPILTLLCLLLNRNFDLSFLDEWELRTYYPAV